MRQIVLILLALLLGGLPGSAQDDEFTCPQALPPRLTLYEEGRVTPGAANIVRVNPATSAQQVGRMPAGTIFWVYDGPVCADGYVWWRVDPGDFRGWTVEAVGDEYALEPYPPITELDGQAITYGHVAFTFDDSLGSVTVRTYPEEQPDPAGPYWLGNTEYLHFRFVDYPVENFVYQPHLSVYPLQEWLALAEFIDEEYRALKLLLEEAPEDLGEVYIPFLPIVNAGRVIQTQAKYLEFQNGRGYRFVTAYAQDVLALANDFTFYTFQGMTNDEQYWVSAIFPAAASILPDQVDYQDPDFDYEAFVENYQAYKAEITEALNALPTDAFTPDLERLDALIESLSVE